MEKLSKKQKKALRIIIEKIKEQGYPPTLKELSDELGAASRTSAVKYLNLLERKGFILWEKNKARGIRVLESMGLMAEEGEAGLPLVGSVTAGLPMLAEQNIERYVTVPRHLLSGDGMHFLLRVKGDSMVNAGILDKDLVVVRSQNSAAVGDVVVALIDGDATVKRLAADKGERYLKAENPQFRDIRPDISWSIQGRVVALVREHVE